MGIVVLGNKFSKEDFSETDLNLLQTMGNCLASSLKNSSLLSSLVTQKVKLNKTLLELETFFDTGKLLHDSEDGNQLYEDLLFRVVSLMNSGGGILYLKQEGSPICKKSFR